MKHRARILIIEDDAEMCEELKELLNNEGYDVDVCCDGKSGIDELEKSKYQIVLLDLKMPNIDGRYVLRYIREKKLPSRVFIITASLFVKVELEEKEGNKIKFADKEVMEQPDEIISKPFDIQNILEKIKKASV